MAASGETPARPETAHLTSLDPERILRLLNQSAVEYLLIGGFAVIVHGYERLTADVDLCYARIGTPDGSDGYADLIRGSEAYELADGLVVRVVGLDDLIRLKRASGANPPVGRRTCMTLRSWRRSGTDACAAPMTPPLDTGGFAGVVRRPVALLGNSL